MYSELNYITLVYKSLLTFITKKFIQREEKGPIGGPGRRTSTN